MAREFVQGKRKKYFSPFNFFLIVAAIYVFMSTFTAKPAVAKANVLTQHPELQRIPDLKKRENLVHIYERSSRAMQFMARHSNLVAMLALPLIAFLFWIFYRRAGYNYIEHLVANMYMSGFTLLCQVIVFNPIGKLLNTSK